MSERHEYDTTITIERLSDCGDFYDDVPVDVTVLFHFADGVQVDSVTDADGSRYDDKFLSDLDWQAMYWMTQ
jgi:hypothetical protein